MRPLSRSALILVILGASLYSPGAANAHWQFTRWGMTPEAVIAASKGTATATTPEERDSQRESRSGLAPVLKAPWQSGKFRFTAFFFFEPESELARISLKLEDPSLALELIGALRGKYGEPDSKSESEVFELLVWRTRDDQVSCLRVGTSLATVTASVRYQPRVSEHGRGL